MKLMKLDSGLFRIEEGATAIEGSWAQIRAQLLYEFEIDPTQLERALDDMREKGNDVADFGVGGYFQFSYGSCVERKVIAELRAIAAVRREFDALAKREPTSPETKQVYDRLMFLYFAQDVESALLLLGAEEYNEMAA